MNVPDGRRLWPAVWPNRRDRHDAMLIQESQNGFPYLSIHIPPHGDRNRKE